MTTGQPTETGAMHAAKSPLIPESWRAIYANPLAKPEHVADFRMEGEAAVTFPLGRMRLESVRDEAEGQRANFVLWCPEDFPADAAISWDFWPVREPGLAIMFLAQAARKAGICSILQSSHGQENTTSIITAK